MIFNVTGGGGTGLNFKVVGERHSPQTRSVYNTYAFLFYNYQKLEEV